MAVAAARMAPAIILARRQGGHAAHQGRRRRPVPAPAPAPAAPGASGGREAVGGGVAVLVL